MRSLFLNTSLLLTLLASATCNGRSSSCEQSGECSLPPKIEPKLPSDDGQVIILGKGGTPFDPKGDGSSGVRTGDRGELVIDPGSVTIGNKPLIWVANSGEGTVSKIDTRTMTEVARYLTGPRAEGNDPSRTTVGLNGDVVVANRSGGSVVHIAGDLSQCKDTNTDGSITTSSGPGDVKPWGQDECVLWHLDLPRESYPRAAVFDAQYGLDGQLSTTVYIGAYQTGILYRIDATTGRILKEIAVGGHPYGAAIDKSGVVWIRDASGSGTVAFVEVNRGDRVGRTIKESPCAYGIAADPEGRIWTSGSGEGGNCAARYTPDPMDLSRGRWDKADLPGADFPRGLAIDAKKTAWVADTSFGVFAVDTETMMVRHSIRLGGNNDFVGMAIDFDGMVWAINEAESRAYRIDPGNVRDVKSMPTGQNPYTYSDMTGFQLRNAAAPTGRFRATLRGCDKSTRWSRVFLDASYEGGTSIAISARTGKDLTELAAQPWVQIGQQPPDASPMKLDKLGPAQTNLYLQIEVQLRTTHPAFSPRLLQIKVGSTCTVLG